MSEVGSAEGRAFVGVWQLLVELGARPLLVRNYDGYPERFSGDVDIYADLRVVAERRADLARGLAAAGWHVYRVVDRPWVLALHGIWMGAPGVRPVFVIEVFDRFSWLLFEYVSFDDVWASRGRHHEFDIVGRPLDGLLTLAHYAYWAGFLPRKYQQSMQSVLTHPETDGWMLQIFGSAAAGLRVWLELYAAQGDEGWEKLRNVPEEVRVIPRGLRRRLRVHAIRFGSGGSPFRLLSAIRDLATLHVQDLARPDGRVVLVNGGGWELLKAAKRFHLFRNSSSVLLRPAKGIRLRATLAAYRAVARGGLCVVELPVSAPRSFGWSRGLAELTIDLRRASEEAPEASFETLVAALR